MKLADIREMEQVHVLDIDNGNRLVTYAINGGPGDVCLNGAAARLVSPGDKVIVLPREGAQGGMLYFVMNFQDTPANVTVRPRQTIASARDLEAGALDLRAGGFAVKLPPRDVKIVYCEE